MIRAGDLHDAFRQAPVCDLDDIVTFPLLVLAPHADDESLATGGLIAEACARGREVHVRVLTDGTGSHPDSPTYPASRLRAVREQEARDAVAILGVDAIRIGFERARDTAAPHSGPEFDALCERMEAFCRANGIATIVTSWRHDPHCDHEAASLLAAEVSRRGGLRHLEAPVWGWTIDPAIEVDTEYPTAMRLDVVAHRRAKRRAIAAHRSQTTDLIQDSPSPFLLEPRVIDLLDQPYEVLIQA